MPKPNADNDTQTEWMLESLIRKYRQATVELENVVGFLIHQARREYEWSWSEIAELLNTNRESARLRYQRWLDVHFHSETDDD